jgi:hypothetical protein
MDGVGSDGLDVLKDVCGRKTCALKKLLAALSSVRRALHGGAKLKVLWQSRVTLESSGRRTSRRPKNMDSAHTKDKMKDRQAITSWI